MENSPLFCEHPPICNERASIFNSNAQTMYFFSYLDLSNMLMYRLEKLQDVNVENIFVTCHTFYVEKKETILSGAFTEASDFLYFLLRQALEGQSKWKISSRVIRNALPKVSYRHCNLPEYGCCFCKYRKHFFAEHKVGDLFNELWIMFLKSNECQNLQDELTEADVKTIMQFFESKFKKTLTAKKMLSYVWDEIDEIRQFAVSEFERGANLASWFKKCEASASHKSELNDFITLFEL